MKYDSQQNKYSSIETKTNQKNNTTFSNPSLAHIAF